jgi:hypothetical protein
MSPDLQVNFSSRPLLPQKSLSHSLRVVSKIVIRSVFNVMLTVSHSNVIT